MRIGLSLIVVMAVAVISACADTHQMKRVKGSGVDDTGRNAVYIAVPADGRYGSTLYTGSGMIVAHEVGAAFSPYFKESTVADGYESRDAAMSTAFNGGYDYLAYPVIVHWEDRATEWSGRPDVTSVKINIIKVSTGKTVDSVVINGTSKIMSWGGDRPEQLLSAPLADYAAELFK